MDTSSWLGYTAAVEKDMTPICSEQPGHKFPATDSKTTWWTGFQELTPANPELQAKYDAMSGSWEGVSPTNKAVVSGLFTSQPLPTDKTLPQYKK